MQRDHHGMERDWPRHMEQRFRESPRLLKQSASEESCCIFRVSRSVFRNDPMVYEPRVVSIGPYHHGKEQVQMLEQHKPRLFAALIGRTHEPLDAYFQAMVSAEEKIRDCYSEDLKSCFGSSGLIEMMVLDACFVVEMFRFAASPASVDPNDPLFSMPWVFSNVKRDLLLLENQIPFFVLETVFDLSRAPTEADCSLTELAFGFFNISPPGTHHELERPYHVRCVTHLLSQLPFRLFNSFPPKQKELEKKRYDVPDVCHLLDCFRFSLIGHFEPEDPGDVDWKFLGLIPSAKQLLRAGIKLEPRKSEQFIGVHFHRGVLHIPPLTLDERTGTLFPNCIAFEQYSPYCSKHITSYTVLMRCLITSATDAASLSQCNILTNFLGSDEDVAIYFNNVARGMSFDISSSYLAPVFGQVNRYCQNKWHVRWSGIKREYFGSAWSLISAAAAFILLALTVLQAFYAVYAYYHPKK